jgi:hypothetical protein
MLTQTRLAFKQVRLADCFCWVFHYFDSISCKLDVRFDGNASRICTREFAP